MRGRGLQEDKVPSNDVRAQAAVWVARLHDEQRAPDLEAELHAWLAQSGEHRRAFDRLTQAWERAGQIGMRARGSISDIHGRRRSRFVPWAAGLAAVLVLAVAAALYYYHDNALVTVIGQRQVRQL